MANNINLLTKAQRKREYRKIRKIAKSGTFVLILLLAVAGVAVYSYWFTQKKESELYDERIETAEKLIESYNDVEQEKSVLTVKTDALQTLHEKRYDYLKTIENIDALFGFSLDISSMTITEDGTVDIDAEKRTEIQISEDEAFDTNITLLSLNLVVPSSDELEETLKNLERYVGSGLDRVTIASSSLNENREYDVTFEMAFTSSATNTDTSANTNDQTSETP